MQNLGYSQSARLQPVGFVVDYDSMMIGIQQIIGQFGGWLMGQAGMRGYFPNDMIELYPILTSTTETSLGKLRMIRTIFSDGVTFTGNSFADVCGLHRADELMEYALATSDEQTAQRAIDAALEDIIPKLEEAYTRFRKAEGYAS